MAMQLASDLNQQGREGHKKGRTRTLVVGASSCSLLPGDIVPQARPLASSLSCKDDLSYSIVLSARSLALWRDMAQPSHYW